jgi:hypothetical protein
MYEMVDNRIQITWQDLLYLLACKHGSWMQVILELIDIIF